MKNIIRKRLILSGIVQGVGFRPFVFNLAKQFLITGHVGNIGDKVVIESQGEEEEVNQFFIDIIDKKPLSSIIFYKNIINTDLCYDHEFLIKESKNDKFPPDFIPIDLATCNECVQEIFDNNNRRFRYPFTNCTNCGPRYSILLDLPYDRINTTMKNFIMCNKCKNEYHDIDNRRFHAQTNTCYDCGPRLILLNNNGVIIAKDDMALRLTVNALLSGLIIAIKGIGGFHLVADAMNQDTVNQLRQRKNRPRKPFALMSSLSMIKSYGLVSKIAEKLLCSKEAPIVLLDKINNDLDHISPNIDTLGFMLPYSPLHHLLLNDLNKIVIATSGNKSDDPVTINDQEALDELKDIADLYLTHDRDIARYIDDSIIKVMDDKPCIIRRARGFSSLPIIIDDKMEPMLSLGSYMKNTFAISHNHNIILSQHIGDLKTYKAQYNQQEEIKKYLQFYKINLKNIIVDHINNYANNIIDDVKLYQCQHHIAHVFSCMAENNIKPPLLGIAFDGSGIGLDNSIWGGEFFFVNHDYMVERIAHVKPFILPLGEKAIRHPKLIAMSLLYDILGNNFMKADLAPVKNLSSLEKINLPQIMRTKFKSPLCSSMGRLFDGVSSLLDLCHEISFAAEAAMILENMALKSNEASSYIIKMYNKPIIIDWAPMIIAMINDLKLGIPQEIIAAKFHNTISNIIINIADVWQINNIVMSGGVFQNKFLLEKTLKALRLRNYTPIFHQAIPCNDGGISLGQIYYVLRSHDVLGSARTN